MKATDSFLAELDESAVGPQQTQPVPKDVGVLGAAHWVIETRSRYVPAGSLLEIAIEHENSKLCAMAVVRFAGQVAASQEAADENG